MPITLAEAVHNLNAGAYPYSDANEKKIRGSANKCPRIPAYNCPMGMIPVDVDAFMLKWAKNVANKDTPEGFDDFKKFKTWHSNVKSLMSHASGRHAEEKRLRGEDDEWKHLFGQVEALIEPNGKGCGVQSTDLISLKVLQSVARENGIQPRTLTSDQLTMWMHDLQDVGRRYALRKGARILDTLHVFSDRIDPQLLPVRIGELPRVSRCRQTPVFPSSVTEAVTSYLGELAVGLKYKGLASNHSRKPLSPRTVTSIREQLAWYFTCLIELGRLDPEGQPDVSELMVLENILAAFDAETAGEFYWTPLGARTNRKNMGAVFRFARRYHPDLFTVQTEFFKGEYFTGWDTMTKENQDFCRRLVRSKPRTHKFLNLPGKLFEQSVDLIDRFDSLSEGQKTNALKIAVATAAAAILMFIPLRADTLVNLSVTGRDADIFFPQNSKDVHLSIPRPMMKNRKAMVAEFGRRGKVDPRKVLEWWMRKARPLVMKQILTPDPTKLLGGAKYHYLADGWRYATADQDIYMTLHQVRHGIASILINEPGADVDVIAALLNNSPATVLKTYAFFDGEKGVQRGMDGLKAVNAALEKGVKK
ncbi:hypothetical protein [Sulfitobacter sp.]|uniref:hypothetical protein n=1 Tax=Sulfitobacter sp. TaxID=1903071 RepID=UPI0039E5ACC0